MKSLLVGISAVTVAFATTAGAADMGVPMVVPLMLVVLVPIALVEVGLFRFMLGLSFRPAWRGALCANLWWSFRWPRVEGGPGAWIRRGTGWRP